MTWDALEKAGADLLRRLGPSALRMVVEHARDAWPRDAILHATPGAETLLDALAGVDRSTGLAYLTGLAAGYAQRAGEVSLETVWSGPASHHVPVRATAAVLADVVREARHELLLMTYSAKPHQPLRDALAAAVSRGVAVSVVVETLQGAGSALSGDEPYQAFTGVPGLELWHWPASKRTEPGGRCTPSSPSPTAASCSSPAPTSPSPASPRISKPAFSSAAAPRLYAPPSTSTPSDRAAT